MDCEKMRQDIDELEKHYNEVNRQFNEATKNGFGRKKLTAASQKLSKLADENLIRYLDVFFEQFPGVGILEKKIDGWPRHIHVTGLAPLPDGSVIATGDIFISLHRIAKDDNDAWTIKEQKDSFGGWSIESIASLPDGTPLIYVDDGKPQSYIHEAFCVGLNRYNQWEEKKKISLEDAVFSSLTTLSDGEFVIGCHYNTDSALLLFYDLNNRHYNHHGGIFPINRIRLPEGNSDGDHTITSLAKTPQGRVLAFRANNDNYVITRDSNSEWQIEKKLNDLKDADGRQIYINTCTSLPNGNLIIGTEDGGLCFATFDESDELRIGKKILLENFNEYTKVSSIALLPDNSLMIGSTNGYESGLHQLILQDHSFDALKKAILDGHFE